MRPADILINNVAGSSNSTALDVSITSPVRSDFIAHSSHIELYAAKQSETMKFNHYKEALIGSNLDFVPFIIESTGAWGNLAQIFMKKIMKMIRDKVVPNTFAFIHKKFLISLSTTIMRHTSRSYLKRLN